ncbi:MAG: uridine phosphorylase [Thermodesulfovibrionales bacterium]|nr:uridine phosphorylase [Thermodesulfovibrionales bacterium]
MIKVYHLDLYKSQVKNSKIVLLTGDPFRVSKIAERIGKQFGGDIEELAWKREYKTIICYINKKPILITSTGIGGPSTSIAIEELAMLGIKTFIRAGTTGAIQKRIRPGDVIITTGSVRLDGASTHYAPIEYPAVADYKVVDSLIKAANKSGVRHHVGITVSSDTFYPGQERYDSFTRYVPKRFQGSMKEWQRLNVLNYEMESSTVLTLCSAMGLRGGCVSGVVVNRTTKEEITEGALKAGEDNAIKVAAASLEYLL